MSARTGDYGGGGRTRQLERMWVKYKGICQICFEPCIRHDDVRSRKDVPLTATREHVIPLVLGGDKEDHNCVLAHLKCNNKNINEMQRAGLLPSSHDPWKSYVQRGIAACIARQRAGVHIVYRIDPTRKYGMIHNDDFYWHIVDRAKYVALHS